MRRTMAAASAQAQGQLQVQWSQEETKELIRIRAELERDSSVAKRGKTLWEAVSSRLSARGFTRTADQCKCKWKNLLNRYKGKETSDPEDGRQCPFFEELHALFTEREKNMKRLLLESEVGSAQSKKKMKKTAGGQSSDEISEDEEEYECDTDEETAARNNSRKRKAERTALDKFSRATSSANRNSETAIQEMLKEFFQKQMMMDMQWREMMERREYERQLFEQEWRQSMEKLERERLMVEQAWREREEQRKIKEESRAEKRDTLLTVLLNKLINDEK